MLAKASYEGDFDRLIRFCKLYDAYQNAPFSFSDFYKIIDQNFPDSRFILTVRDTPDDWYNSLLKFQSKGIGKDLNPPTEEDLKHSSYAYEGFAYDNMVMFYDYPNTSLQDREAYIKIYKNRNREIQIYFEGRDNQLLILNINDPEAFHTLDDFLGFNIPKNKKLP